MQKTRDLKGCRRPVSHLGSGLARAGIGDGDQED